MKKEEKKLCFAVSHATRRRWRRIERNEDISSAAALCGVFRSWQSPATTMKEILEKKAREEKWRKKKWRGKNRSLLEHEHHRRHTTKRLWTVSGERDTRVCTTLTRMIFSCCRTAILRLYDCVCSPRQQQRRAHNTHFIVAAPGRHRETPTTARTNDI